MKGQLQTATSLTLAPTIAPFVGCRLIRVPQEAHYTVALVAEPLDCSALEVLAVTLAFNQAI